MKLLVFSDSHGNTALMERETALQRPDMVLHLGDVVRDARTLARRFPDVPMACVPGNCDAYVPDLPEKRLLEVEGKKLLMTHGHIYHVKSDIGTAVYAAQEARADVLLFGHTHQALCDRQGPLWILNPGSIRGNFHPTYGVITLENGVITCYTVAVS